MSRSHLYPTLPRSDVSYEALESIGKIPYSELEREQRWSLAAGKPGDLQVILDSALAAEPPNESIITAISAICERGIYLPTQAEHICSYPVLFYEVGKKADVFLSGHHG